MFKIIASIVALVSAIIVIRQIREVPKIPDLDLDKLWGGDSISKQEDTSIRQFKIEFNDTNHNRDESTADGKAVSSLMVTDLKERLRNRRPLTKPLEGIQSEYGVNTIYLNEVLSYWEKQYDFRKRAKLLNQFEHYKTTIQGLELHFIRSKPKVQKGLKVLPLLMLHGWPSSSKEFDKLIPTLSSPKEGFDFVYDVVAADLPGFGFSEGTNKPGFTPVQIGIVMRNLMRRLGFKQFYIQAGDWGSQCATHMSTLFPDEVLGLHTNMPISSSPISFVKTFLGSLYPTLAVDARYVDRIYPLSSLFKYILRVSGYFHIQATKPDTIGVGLTDSPAGLAAWIIEIMAFGTNRDSLDKPHGGLEELDLNDVLDTLTINWANNCIVTSMRIYTEGFSKSTAEVNTFHRIPTTVPTAVINFKYEVLYQPDWILRDKFPNLVHSTTLLFGGHFAALQTPDVLAQDIFEATVEFLKFHSKTCDVQD